MFRTFNAIFATCLFFGSISGLVGCRFCASPYDYCCPTYTGDHCDDYLADPCHPNYTAGSRFLGTEGACQSCSVCAGSGVDQGCSSCSTGYSSESGSDYVSSEYESSGYEDQGGTVILHEGEGMKSVPQVIQKVPTPAPSVSHHVLPPSPSKKKTQLVSAQKNYASQPKGHYKSLEKSEPISLSELREIHPDTMDGKTVNKN